MYYVGIDIAKRRHVASVKDEVGRDIGSTLDFSNDADGFESLVDWLSGLGVGPQDSVVAMESTAHYWIALYAWLDDRGFGQAVVNPILTEAFRSASSVRKTKTDASDAATIAEFARFKGLEPQGDSPEVAEGLRRITRFRAELVRQRTMLKNRARSIADRLFPELPSLFKTRDSTTERMLLCEFGSASTIAKTDIRKLTRVISDASRGSLGRAKAEEVKAAAKRSVAPGWAEDALAFEISSVFRLISEMDEQIAALEAKAAELADSELLSLLQTIPGVGPVSAAVILAEVGDADRFAEPKKLTAYAGMDASVKDSGDSVGKSGQRMSKRGSSYLRFALMLSADAARRVDPYFGDYYNALRARGKHHYVAVSGVARKLCGVILAIMKERRPYERRPSVQSLGNSAAAD